MVMQQPASQHFVGGEGSAACASGGLHRLPVGHELMQHAGILCVHHAFAQLAIAKHLGDFGKNFQMLLRGRLRHKQKDQQAHRLIVGRIEADRVFELEQGGQRRLEPLDAAMRNRHSVPQAGRSQALSCKETVGDEGPIEVMQFLEQEADFFKCTLFAAGVHMDDHLLSRKDGS